MRDRIIKVSVSSQLARIIFDTYKVILLKLIDSQLKKKKNTHCQNLNQRYIKSVGAINMVIEATSKCQLCLYFTCLFDFFFKQIYWCIIKKDNFDCLYIKVSQKEACLFSTQINFDSGKCNVARMDSVILVKSETLIIQNLLGFDPAFFGCHV